MQGEGRAWIQGRAVKGGTIGRQSNILLSMILGFIQ